MSIIPLLKKNFMKLDSHQKYMKVIIYHIYARFKDYYL